MARSKKRKKGEKEATDDTTITQWTDGIPLSPAWWAPAFVTIMLLGLVYLVVFYFTNGAYPIPGIKNYWNILIGIGIILIGFLMTLRWR